jgi:hypothetical protein
MLKHCIVVSSLVLAILLIACSNDARSTESKEAKQVTCSGRVVDEQDRPINGAKVTLIEMMYSGSRENRLTNEAVTDTAGKFSLTTTTDGDNYKFGYIVAQKEGLALGFDNWRVRDVDKEFEITLGRAKELAGTVVDENNVPVSGAKVSVSMLVLGEGERQKGMISAKLLTTSTDAAGKFTFTGIPADATAEFVVKKAGKATVNTYKHTGIANQKLNYIVGQADIKLTLPVEARIEGIVVDKNTGKPVGGMKLKVLRERDYPYLRRKPVASNQDGTFCVDALVSDRYVLELVSSQDRLADWIAGPVEVITKAGKTKSGIRVELSKGGLLEVKVKDAVSKEPIEDARVSVKSPAGNRSAYGRSDKDGLARMRLMPGDYLINQIYKQDYSRRSSQDLVTIEYGKVELIEYELAGLPIIRGVVRDEEDKPIEGVELEVCPRGVGEESTSNADGRFEIVYDLGRWSSVRTSTIFLVGRHEKRNLATAIQIDEDTRQFDIKLEPGVLFTGKVADSEGNGIKGATFSINLRASNWGSPIGRDFPVSDGHGNFEIKAIPAGHKYNLYTRAEGFGVIRKQVNVEDFVDHCFDVGTITLPVANLSISGVVVYDNDKPAAGVRIYCYGDSQPRRNTQTDVDGKFAIEKVCAGRIRISANKTGAAPMYGYVEADGGATDVRIVISERSASISYEPSRPPWLVNTPLPELKEIGMELPPADTDGKILLVCFFDMEQRPSRHCVTQLTNQAGQLVSKGVTIIAVHASKMDQTALNQWVKKYNLPFPVGMARRDVEKTCFAWGVRSLPWLILTDQKHVIRASGFSMVELDRRLEGIKE